MAEKQYIRLLKGFSVGLKCKYLIMDREIMFDSNLTLIEKVIVAIVQGYQKGDKDCFVSNQMLADICSCKRLTIIRSINRLKSAKVLHSRFKVIQGQTKRILWV